MNLETNKPVSVDLLNLWKMKSLAFFSSFDLERILSSPGLLQTNGSTRSQALALTVTAVSCLYLLTSDNYITRLRSCLDSRFVFIRHGLDRLARTGWAMGTNSLAILYDYDHYEWTAIYIEID